MIDIAGQVSVTSTSVFKDNAVCPLIRLSYAIDSKKLSKRCEFNKVQYSSLVGWASPPALFSRTGKMPIPQDI